MSVVRRARRGRVEWLARWRDPASGRRREVSLETVGARSREARTAWARRKSEELARERAALGSGRRHVEELEVGEAIDDYLARCAERLAPRTVEIYRQGLEFFRAWARGARASSLSELTPEDLARFREWLLRQRKRTPVRKGRRGESARAEERRSPVTANTNLRAIRSWLNEARRFGRTPRITRDDVVDCLASARAPLARPRFLRPPEIRQFVEAALRHDRATFSLTREEKSMGHAGGETRRHEPVAPFVLCLLLTGMRLGEGRRLRWRWCYLGGPRPEIVIPHTVTKTRHERAVDLSVSPVLVRLLEGLRLRSAGEFVFGGERELAEDWTKGALRRLVTTYGAPKLGWQVLRSTCATYSTCSAVFGSAAASPYMSARRLGHSVLVAEQRYLGLIHVSPEARTLEQAMECEDLAEEIVREARGVVEGDAQDVAEG